MILQWIKKGSGNNEVIGQTISVDRSSGAMISQVLPRNKSWRIDFSNSSKIMIGICLSEFITATNITTSYPRDVRTLNLYSGTGNLYPADKNVGFQSWTTSDKISFVFDESKKRISVYKNDTLKITPFIEFENKDICIFVSGTSTSSVIGTALYNFESSTSTKYLLQTTDSLYTIAPDGTLKNLGSVATADKMALFASDGFETLTKANCETIASQLGKCKILRAEI